MKSLHPVHDEPMRHYPHIILTLVHHAAVRIIKEQLAARGEKVREYSMKDLRNLADAYVAAHRDELIRMTIVKVRTSPDLLSLAEKEARRRGRMWPLPQPQTDNYIFPIEFIR